MVVFHDWTLDCRTDGTAPVRDKTLAELKRLDVGYGYTADGGKTFPLRGRGVGGDADGRGGAAATSRRMPLVFNFKSKDPRDADAARRRLPPRRGRDRRAVTASTAIPRVTGRHEAARPRRLDLRQGQAMKACLTDYVKFGWTGYVPESCRNTTVAVPLNYQWAIWGWPNRFLDRMAGVGTKVILMGDYEDGVARRHRAARAARQGAARLPRLSVDRGYLQRRPRAAALTR